MPLQWPTLQSPSKWPLIQQPEQRGTDVTQDARVVNGYGEKHGEDWWVYKRPGLAAYQTVSGATGGLGSIYWRGHHFSVFGSKLYKDGGSPITLGGTPNGKWDFSFMRGATIGIGQDLMILGNGIWTGYINDGGVAVTQITDADFPTFNAKGFAVLNGRMYIMDAWGQIFNSAANNPSAWAATDFLRAQIEADLGVYLTRQSSYIVAMKEWSTEIFYDAGNATGSLLGPIPGAKLPYGCYDGDTVAQIDDILIWVTANRDASPEVILLEKLQVTVVSIPVIEKSLDGNNSFLGAAMSAFGFKMAGHRFYCLNCSTLSYTMVYDLDQKLWFYWTDGNGLAQWPVVSVVPGLNGQDHIAQGNDIELWKLKTCFQQSNDDGTVPAVDIYTPYTDLGIGGRFKVLQEMSFDVDKVASSALQFAYTEDDYQTWSTFRSVGLGNADPRAVDHGTFVKRAYNFRHRWDTAFRIKAVNLAIDLGTA